MDIAWPEVITGIVTGGLGYLGGAFFGRPVRRLVRRTEPLLGALDIAPLVQRDPANMPFVGLDFATRFYFPSDFALPSDAPEFVSEWWFWAHSMGGYDVGRTKVLITLQGVEDAATIMVGAPKIDALCSPLEPGVICGPGGLGGGGVRPRRYEVSLFASRPPEVRYLDQGDLEPQFTLSKGETEQIALLVTAEDPGYHEWTCKVPLVVNGVERSLDVRNGRDPFVTVAATPECRGYIWAGGRWHESSGLGMP